MQVLRDTNEPCPLRNEASLKFVSLRSQVDAVGRGAPSRVKMNALRAPLTALHVSMREYLSFSLDSADAFIDIRFFTQSRGFLLFPRICQLPNFVRRIILSPHYNPNASPTGSYLYVLHRHRR
jgi:hypothetical protein